jgi:hypothetical protein
MKCEFVSKTRLLPKPDFPSSPLEEEGRRRGRRRKRKVKCIVRDMSQN